MKAKIRDVSFNPDNIVIGVDFYFSEEEADYNNCWIDVPDRPAAFEGEVVPTHKEFVPFRSVSMNFPVDVSRDAVGGAIVNKLRAFKRAYAKSEAAQQLVGYEVEE